jgi:hypothetical protein
VGKRQPAPTCVELSPNQSGSAEHTPARSVGGAPLVATVLNGASAYSWACVGRGVSLGIDVTGACTAQYGQNAVAALGSMSNPWSWACQWAVTAQMRAAAAWAIAERNSPLPAWSDHFHAYWSGFCERFVEQAEAFRFNFPSAIAAYNWQNAHGRIHHNARPPRGAIVYWSGGRYGHTAVSLGWGQAIGTYGYVGQRYPVRQYPVVGYLSNTLLGWAYPTGS